MLDDAIACDLRKIVYPLKVIQVWLMLLLMPAACSSDRQTKMVPDSSPNKVHFGPFFLNYNYLHKINRFLKCFQLGWFDEVKDG